MSGLAGNIFVVLLSPGIQCPELNDPANGQVTVSPSSRLFRATAMYICFEGYRIHGGDIRVCSAGGQWTSEAPKCYGMLFFI